jgi:formylglycine-generating enzyme required for sulfatase activity
VSTISIQKTMTCSSGELEKRYTSQLEELRTELQKHIHLGMNDIAKFLADDSFDSKLVQFVILNDGTPRALADFASQDDYHSILIDQMLNDNALMKEMLLADGAKALPKGPAQYGPAIKIYTDILNQTIRATWGGTDIFSRLALAIALEHAVPISQNSPKATADEDDEFVDPVLRYMSYEAAYLNEELDPDFDVLTTWELRFVVDGNEPDKISAWGRIMLRNYRPDHVFHRRYVRMVNSNIRYGSQDVKCDKDELQQYQNILMNGGVCGRRAFFGRFILRAFGIPTTARPSPGHGALVHWTPDQGWVVALGGSWGSGWTKTLYHKDLDFLATTQARAIEEAFWAVKKAQWVGDVMGEKRVYGEHDVKKEQIGFWYNESLTIQRAIIEAFPDNNSIETPYSGPVGLTLMEQVAKNPITPNASKILCNNDNIRIIIPAASYQNPRRTKDVQAMPCFRGGHQIYLPPFSSQGLTIMRGGTWKNDHNGCCSGARIMSGGFGKYGDWGFRVAISGNDDAESCPVESLTIHLNGKDSTVQMEFVYIKAGSFLMGGESATDGRFQCVEVPKHPVKISKGFYLGKYPVTQAQYEAVMKINPSKSTKAPDCPVDNIGEQDALDFCSKLVENFGKDFRLPTEAEWEYACRAGQGDTKWFFGNDPSRLHEYAWFKDNSGGKSHPVGQLKPNPFGLYGMNGNVYERVADKYSKDYYANSPLQDPTGPVQGTKSLFEYKVQAPQQGTYRMTAEVVTVNDNQQLNVCVNGNKSAEIAIILPFTNGYWRGCSFLTIVLKEGQNTMRFWRDKPPQYGISIRQFTLELIPESAC